jgi:hypothetical protein
LLVSRLSSLISDARNAVKRSIVVGAALLVISSAPRVAHAEPLVPQADTSCPASLAGALVQLPDLTTLLKCKDGRWHVFDDPYPSSERWLTYGPELTLHGEAQRNREIDSGDWIGYPQDPGAQCKAEQLAIAETGSVGPPEVSTGDPGQVLKLSVRPLLFTVELSGHCLWQSAAVGGPAPNA